MISSFESDCFFLYGLGKSNRACAAYFEKNNIAYVAWDDHLAAREQFMASFPNAQLRDLHHHTFKPSDGLLISPGIRTTFPVENTVYHNARQAGAYIGCDVDLFLRLNSHKTIIGVTGTNGKSTVVSLLEHVLKEQGFSVAAGGNIGRPAFDLPESDVYVMELSSFQLALMHEKALDAALIINIKPDHLDHHGSFEAYALAKLKIYDLGKPGCFSLYGEDALPRGLPLNKSVQHRCDFEEQQKELAAELIAANLGQYQAPKRFENALCAYLALNTLFQMSVKDFGKALQTFSDLPHRQQVVKQHQNVVFINDSKATNCASALAAVSSFETIYWIVGGIFKESVADLEIFKPYKDRIVKMYCYGKNADIFYKFGQQLNQSVERYPDLLAAVSSAAFDAMQAGVGVVLLSPCCSSFDQFKNFEERGNMFAQIVQALDINRDKK